MAYEVPADLAEKAAIMREFGRRRAAGEPVSEELLCRACERNQRSITPQDRSLANASPISPFRISTVF